jgi:hypothetical protein
MRFITKLLKLKYFYATCDVIGVIGTGATKVCGAADVRGVLVDGNSCPPDGRLIGNQVGRGEGPS